MTKVSWLKDTEGYRELQHQIARVQVSLGRLCINLEKDLDGCEENDMEVDFSKAAREVFANEIGEAKRSKAVGTDKSRRDAFTRLSRAMETMRSMDTEENFTDEGDALLKSILTTETSILGHEAKGDDWQQRADLDRVSAWLNDNAQITSDNARDTSTGLQVRLSVV